MVYVHTYVEGPRERERADAHAVQTTAEDAIAQVRLPDIFETTTLQITVHASAIHCCPS